jgi:hypothetical protein
VRRAPAAVWAAIALGLAAAGCGAGKANPYPDAPGNGDGGVNPDAPPACTTYVDFAPASPIAGAAPVVATGHVDNGSGFSTYAWIVRHAGADVAYTTVDLDGKTIQFDVPDPGPYDVHFEAGPTSECQATDTTLNVEAPGANVQAWRVRVVPPTGAAAPPQERLVNVKGGADFDYGTFSLDPGAVVAGTVVDGTGAPVTGYLRFAPEATPDVPVEAFAAADGTFQVRVQGARHDVLIVPSSGALAPVRVVGWQLEPQLVVPDGAAITGVVDGPGGGPLAGARVELSIDGVPTTVATTDGAGAWTVLGHAGGAVDLTVVPPAVTGLPRLDIAGATLDLTQPVAVRYAASIAAISVGGAAVHSAGAPAPGARVTFTGTVAAAGTATAGSTTAAARGSASAVAVADGAGVLPATLVVAAPLTAVVEPSPAVAAVVAVDTSGGAPAVIDAPAPVQLTGTATDPAGAPRAGVRVRLVPTGALAIATTLAPAAVSGADGTFSIDVAPGGHYALAATDLALRYAALDVPDVVAGDQGALALGPAIALTGGVAVSGGGGVGGAAVTLLCATCAGVDRSRAFGEAVTSGGGDFKLAVPDPGTALR